MKNLPRWIFLSLVLPSLGIILVAAFSAMPMQAERRLANASYFMAAISLLFLGFSIFDAIFKSKHRPRIVLPLLGYAAGAACLGRWEWNMGQAWHLPRAQRLALDMTTLPTLGLACIVAATVGMLWAMARKAVLARERLSRSA
jgi:hypothetical protein